MTTNTGRTGGTGRMGRTDGFSLVELLVATALLLTISGIVTQAILQMTLAQATIWNRTEMHSGVRGATELLQQEVGQAGRITLPAASSTGQALSLQLTSALAARPTISCDPGTPTSDQVVMPVAFKDTAGTTITSVPAMVATTGLYGSINPLTSIFATAGPPAAYELFTTMDGQNSETIKVASVDASGSTITACYQKAHASGTVLMPLGGFANGIIPNTGITNPSTASVLKLFGDINGDGNMVYVEYRCDTNNHVLTRYVMPYNMTYANKVANQAGNTQTLLANIMPNPGNAGCFTYQYTTLTVQGTAFTFVLDVAITLTVQSQQIDPITKQKQVETKALLNVSPRNVYTAWAYANIGYTDRIQSTPTTVSALLQP